MATASSQAFAQLRHTIAQTLHASLSCPYLLQTSMHESQNWRHSSIISSDKNEFLEQNVAHISQISAQFKRALAQSISPFSRQ
jgi:hypothetical protein